jgi:hypothetical protein
MQIPHHIDAEKITQYSMPVALRLYAQTCRLDVIAPRVTAAGDAARHRVPQYGIDAAIVFACRAQRRRNGHQFGTSLRKKKAEPKFRLEFEPLRSFTG